LTLPISSLVPFVEVYPPGCGNVPKKDNDLEYLLGGGNQDPDSNVPQIFVQKENEGNQDVHALGCTGKD